MSWDERDGWGRSAWGEGSGWQGSWWEEQKKKNEKKKLSMLLDKQALQVMDLLRVDRGLTLGQDVQQQVAIVVEQVKKK